MKLVYFFGIVLGFQPLLGASLHAADSNILVQIQQRYQEISSFQGDFVQQNYLSLTEKFRQASGMVSYIRPGKMRWDYHKPNEQLLVTDGITLWLFDPLLENVTVQSLEEVTPGTPLSFLLGVGNLEEDFEHRPTTQTFIENEKMLVVELKPKNSIAALDFIQLAVDPQTYDFKQIVLVDLQANYRLIAFENMQYNLSLDAQRFQFEITPEMEVIQANP